MNLVSTDLRSLAASEAILVLSAIVEDAGEAAPQFKQLQYVTILTEWLSWLLTNGHSHADRLLRNDILVVRVSSGFICGGWR